MAKRPRRPSGLSRALGLDKPKRRASSKRLLASNAPLRRATPAENVKMGFEPTARRYVKADARVTTQTASISAGAAENKRSLKLYGVSRHEATRRRDEGTLHYSSRMAGETAEKNKATAYARKLRRRIEIAAQRRERIPEYAGPGIPKPPGKRIWKGGRRFTVRTGFQARSSHAERILELRERKLAGEELDDGDWHTMMDYAEYFKDPERERLRSSPGSFTVKADLENE
jgi:hypothetical protein